MGAESSTCSAGARKTLFSLVDLKEWKKGKGANAGLSVSSRYHIDCPVTEKYVLTDKILGTGMSGPVYLGRGKAHSLAKRMFAVKMFKKKRGMDLSTVKREVAIFLGLDHPNIARLEDVFDYQSEIYLVMERLEGGELFDRVAKLGAYKEDIAMEACRTMCRAVAYLHSQNPPIVHRDLKPENFLYTKKDSDHLKLIDFGLSTVWDRNTHPRMSECCGTVAYMAPEVSRRGSLYTEKCDIFSLGVISYVLLTGHPPFVHPLEMSKYRPFDQPTFTRLSAAAKSFVRCLMEPDPNNRPSAEEALQNAWLLPGAAVQDTAIGEEVLRSMRKFANASHLKRSCLSMMAWSLTFEDRKMLEESFMEMDKNGNGRISLNELKEVLQRNFAINSSEAESLFERVDDGDAEICFSEFLAAAMQERIRMHEDALYATFARFDKGNKGVITANDLSAILDVGFGDEAEKLVREMNPNGSSEVTSEQFIRYLTTWEEEPPEEVEEVKMKRLTSSLRGGRAALASRLIDRQFEKEEEVVQERKWSTFSVAPTRSSTNAPGPLTRIRLVKSWA